MDERDILYPLVFFFVVWTGTLGPIMLGWFLGRYGQPIMRLMPLFLLLPPGIFFVKYSDHGFGVYVLGNIFYALACVAGVRTRLRKEGGTLLGWESADSALLLGVTIVYCCLYNSPIM